MFSSANPSTKASALSLSPSDHARGTRAVEPPASATEIVTERRRFLRPLPAVDVDEGNGGETQWDLWMQAVATSDLANSFPPTEQSPLGPL